MYEVSVSDEIYEFITMKDFNKLVSVPGLMEDDIDFIRFPKMEFDF